MKRIWLIGLALIPTLALSGIQALPSQAEPLEDCYEVAAPKTGDFSDAACKNPSMMDLYVLAGPALLDFGNGEICVLVNKGTGTYNDPLCSLADISGLYTRVLALQGKWLANGGEITTTITSDTSGELLFEDMGAAGKPDVVCSILFEGTVGPGSSDSIEKIVDLENKSPLKCTDKNGICSTPVAVTPLHLPWSTLLTVDGETLRDGISNSGAGEAGYTVDCNSLLGLVEDTCEGNTSGKVTNVEGGVEDSFEEGSISVNCTLGGAGQGLIEGKMLTTGSGQILSVD